MTQAPQTTPSAQQADERRARWLVGAAMGIPLVLHALASDEYGLMGDELYYLACAKRLDFGYVDHPPLSIWILAGWVGLFGDGITSLRVLPALAGSATVWLTATFAKRFGAGAAGRGLAALFAALCPVYLGVQSFFSMNAFDVVLWAAALLLFVDAVRAPSDRRFAALGALLGLGLLNKIGVLWLGAGFAMALLIGHRELLRTRGPWLAAAVAGAFFLPHVVWQLAHDFPTLEFIRVATTEKMLPVSFAEFWWRQLLVIHPLLAPVWLVGLGWLLFAREARPWRGCAIAYLTVVAILLANGTSRANYLAPAYPPLLAAGALLLARASARRGWRWLAPGTAGLYLAVGIGGAIFALPLLAPAEVTAFSERIGIAVPAEEKKGGTAVPSHLSARRGWREMTAAIARVWHALPEEDRRRGAILAHDYSMAGGIDRHGPDFGLPPAISSHNSYWQWRDPAVDGSLLLIVDGDRETLATWYREVRPMTTLRCDGCRPGRDGAIVWLARGPLRPFDGLWADIRHYD